jgi:large subunit ribosomal protein L4
MAVLKVYDQNKQESGDITLAPEVFEVPVRPEILHLVVRAQRAAWRAGTHSTLNRSMMKGGGAKPWRQKGTGRARTGSNISPIWRGGAVIFGPKPRDFSWSLPKKAKRHAIKAILSLKAQSDTLKIIEDFSIESGKTKDLAGLLGNFNPGMRTVLILKDDDPMIKRAAANIPWLSYLSYNRLRAHDLFYGRQILMLETAAKNLNSFYGKSKSEGAEDSEEAGK